MIHWDGSISLGNVGSAFVCVLSVIRFYYLIDKRLSLLEQRFKDLVKGG